MRNNKKGLTLIELIAVIAIIAILFVLLLPQINSAIYKSKESGFLVDFRNYEIAARAYFSENKGKTITAEDFNKYLDKELQIVDNNSVKKNSYGEKYNFHLEGNYKIRIRSKISKTEVIDFEVFLNENGETETKLIGNRSSLVEEKTSGDFKYVVKKDNTIAIAGYIGKDVEVVVPEKIENKKVTEISAYAFSPRTYGGRNLNKVKIKKITLPNTIENIGLYAFNQNELIEFVAPNSLRYIDRSALEENKIENVTLNNGLKFLGFGAFLGNKIKEIDIPKSVDYIDYFAFADNLNIKINRIN